MHRPESIGHDRPDANDHQHHASGGCCGGRAKPAAHDHASPSASGGCCGGSAKSSGAANDHKAQPAGGCGSGSCGCHGSAGDDAVGDLLAFTREQMRTVDRLAVSEFAMPSIILMENAARGVAGVIQQGLQGLASPTIIVLAGPGNNGGDGLAVARHLANRGMTVGIILAAEATRYTGDSGTNLEICRRMNLPIVQAHGDAARATDQMIALLGQPEVVIDALLGTGATAAAHGTVAELIARANALREDGSTLVSIDLPSGLDADAGSPCRTDAGEPGPCITADLTVTLGGLKAGFVNEASEPYLGEMVIVDIGVPDVLLRRLGTPLKEMKAKMAAAGAA